MSGPTRLTKKPSFSKYLGVTQARDYFGGAVQVAGARHFVGNWPTQRDAAIARDRALLYFDPNSTRLNFAKVSRRLGPLSPKHLKAEANATAKAKRGCHSPYRGISWSKWHGWILRLPQGRQLCGFATDEEAAMIRDQVLRHEGQLHLLNFLDRDLVPKSLEQIQSERSRARAKARQGAIRFRGVYPHSDRPDRWGIKISVNGQSRDASGFHTMKMAALAYDRAVLYYGLSKTHLNFPKLARTLTPSSIEELKCESRARFKAKTSSRYRGVTLHRGRWDATIKKNRKVYELGSFEDEEDAAHAYDRAAIKLYGPNARLNFHPVTGRKLYGRWIRPH